MPLAKKQLFESILEIVKATDLDCSSWHNDAQHELAEEISEEVWKLLKSTAKPNAP